MPEVKNCLTCLYEPGWEYVKAEDNHGFRCGFAESCLSPAHLLPKEIRRDCLVRFYPDEWGDGGDVYTGGEYMKPVEITGCPAHQPKENA